MTHRCGGALVAGDVSLRLEERPFTFVYRVPGWTCAQCAEQLVARDATTQRAAQVPTVVWPSP